MSVLMSQARQPDLAENWDEDFEFNRAAATTARHPDAHDPSTPLPREKSHARRSWAEPGPSTPLKRLQQTENWDDDFQDTDSPRSSARPPPLAPSNSIASRELEGSSPVENWDEDFEDSARSGTSPRRRTPRKKGSWGSSDEDDEYGFADREDDRTVTTRSRGVPFHIPTDIPPPVPPLPSPFPRSPTASVFSVPVSSTTGRESVAGYSYSSHAHLPLRPTISGGPSAAVAARLALLPPSPPIHRERRRLRKKSRPPHHIEEGIFELEDRAEPPEPPRPATPDHPKRHRADLPPTSLDDPPPDIGNTSAGKTPLLSRIGSVGKKWGAGRKKRASTGPSEVMIKEHIPRERERDRYPDSEGSRPTSFIASSSPGHGGPKSWFFRGGGGGQGPGSPQKVETPLKHEKSVERLLHLMGVEREERDPGSPSSHKGKGRHAKEATSASLPPDLEEVADDGTDVPTSTLLFGGLPRRPTSMQVSIQASSSGSSWSTRPPVPRHVSYGDGRLMRPTTPSSRASSRQRSASASVEDVQRAKKSSTATRETADGHSSDAPPLETPAADEKGSRRFMGGMRRISLVGSKHKRRKSVAAQESERQQRPATAASSSAQDTQTETAHDNTTPRPPTRVARSPHPHNVPLLPPIELQPPSPPRPKGPPREPPDTPTRVLEPSRSHPSLGPRTPQVAQEAAVPSPSPSQTHTKPSTSPVQTASLGRTAQPPKERDGPSTAAFLRRNSLGDLKIPARISQAQVSLKRDLSMVRDFAASVEQLKQLQATYAALASQLHTLIHDPQESQSRPVSPSFVPLPKPATRSRAQTNPTAHPAPSRAQLASALLSIEARYRLSWECAALLVDLGGGGADQPASPPPSSTTSAPSGPHARDVHKSRERAITLAGDEQKPLISPLGTAGASPPMASPPPAQWRASTGRHDLSQRQLLLLREMLTGADPAAPMSAEPNIPEHDEDINRHWRWGDAMNSTVTLPSEDSGPAGGQPSPTKKRRTSRLGMRGLRDMLKSLKKSYTDQGQSLSQARAVPRVPPSSSSVSASTDSSLNLARPESAASRHRPRAVHPNSPYGTAPPLAHHHKSSPRRPSLASIFRLGQRPKTAHPAPAVPAGSPSGGSAQASRSGTSLGDEEDWHRVESASDLALAARALARSSDTTATVRGKKGHPQLHSQSPYLFQRPAPAAATAADRAHSQASLRSLGSGGASPQKPPPAIPPSVLQSYTRAIKLSDVREVDSDAGEGAGAHRPSARSPSPSPWRAPSRGRRAPTGSVRSAPPQPQLGEPGSSANTSAGALPDVKLAMAPENIKPLLENAREVHARCAECIGELEALLVLNANAHSHSHSHLELNANLELNLNSKLNLSR